LHATLGSTRCSYYPSPTHHHQRNKLTFYHFYTHTSQHHRHRCLHLRLLLIYTRERLFHHYPHHHHYHHYQDHHLPPQNCNSPTKTSHIDHKNTLSTTRRRESETIYCAWSLLLCNRFNAAPRNTTPSTRNSTTQTLPPKPIHTHVLSPMFWIRTSLPTQSARSSPPITYSKTSTSKPSSFSLLYADSKMDGAFQCLQTKHKQGS